METTKQSKLKSGMQILGTYKWCIVAFFTVFLYFCAAAQTACTTTTDAYDDNGSIDLLTGGGTHQQTFTCEEDCLDSIKLYFSTGGQIILSNLYITLYQGETEIQQWEIKCNKLSDDAYYTLKLDKVQQESEGKTYRLAIVTDASEDAAIGIYKTTDATGLTVDGAAIEEAWCYQLVYEASLWSLWESDVNAWHLNAAVIILVLLVLSLWLVRKRQIEWVFLAAWVWLSLLYLICSTPFNVPDEEGHFCRALEVSYHHWVSILEEETNRVGYFLQLDGVDTGLLEKSWESFSQSKDMEISDTYVFKDFRNMAVYAPFSYTAQAAGIFIARHLTKNLAVIYYAGRIAAWLVVTLLAFLAIRLLPKGKLILALIFLTPMNLHEAVSLAPDATVTALTALIIGYVLYLRYSQEESLKKHQILVLYFLAFWIAMMKLVHLPVILFFLLIPPEKVGGIKKLVLHGIGVIIVSVLPSLWWVSVCKNFAVKLGTDAGLQMAYILQHPFGYILTLTRTIHSGANSLVMQMMGNSLAELNVSTTSLLMLAYFSVIVWICSENAHRGSVKSAQQDVGILLQKWISVVVVIGMVFLIYLSEYMYWSAVYSTTIYGIQGRHLLPFLLPLYLCFCPVENAEEPNRDTLHRNHAAIVVAANACACIALLLSCL